MDYMNSQSGTLDMPTLYLGRVDNRSKIYLLTAWRIDNQFHYSTILTQKFSIITRLEHYDDFGRIYKDIMYLDPNIRMVTYAALMV